MESALIVKGFEIGGAVIYMMALIFSLKTRNPFYLGLFFSCNLMVFWDWIFNLKWFFNVTFHEEATVLWEMAGERETLTAALAFVSFYYWVFHLLIRYRGTLDGLMGRWQYPLIYVASAIYVLAFEILFVNLGVWEYHQKESFELYGVAYSNAWLNAHMILGGYLLLRYSMSWAQISDAAVGFNLRTETFWKSSVLALSAPITGIFLAFALQMIWYINAQPWIESPRLF